MDAILEPLERLAEVVDAHWENILLSLAVFFAGWLVARLIRVGISKGLRMVRFDYVAEKAGIDEFLKKGGIKQDAVDLLAALMYWILIVVLILMVMRIWDIELGLGAKLVGFLPKIFIALVILILGLYLASFLGDMVRTAAANAEMIHASMFGQVVRWVIVIFVVLTAMGQLEIETRLLELGFLIVIGSFCLGCAIALGLGAKDLVNAKLKELVGDDKKKKD